MINSYTISSIKDIQNTPYDRVQFTLNGRFFPGKRKTVEALKKVNNTKAEIYVHQDYFNTIPRYPISAYSLQKQVIQELVDIIQYAEEVNNVKGIIIHSDSPFRQDMIKEMKKEMINTENVNDFTSKYYNSNISIPFRDISALFLSVLKNDVTFIDTEDPTLRFTDKWYKFAFHCFYLDLKEALSKAGISNPKCKIFVENTVKTTHRLNVIDVKNPANTMFAVPGTLTSNLVHIQGMQDIYGICWDLEHSFASNDYIPSEDFHEFIEVKDKAKSLLVHLNTIEKSVERGNFKDRHSSTTIADCSKYDFFYYIALAKYLDSLNISYIREVKDETAKEEFEIQQRVLSKVNG